MSIPFVIISVLGLTVFFRAGGWPVGVLFTGLALVYVAEFFASFKLGVTVGADGEESTNAGEKALGAGPRRRRRVADVPDGRHHAGHHLRLPSAGRVMSAGG